MTKPENERVAIRIEFAEPLNLEEPHYSDEENEENEENDPNDENNVE